MGCNGKGKEYSIGKLATQAEKKKQGRAFKE
jgi:signal recognition particle GTPase